MMFRVLKLSAILGGALLATGLQAQGPVPGGGPGFGDHRAPFERALGPMGERGRWWNNPQMIEKLKLTDAQRKAMDETLQAHREKLIDLRANLEKAELGMEEQMRDEEQPNEGKILAQIDKVAAARAELEKANARFLLAIRAKLTPEQWKQLAADRMNHGPAGIPEGAPKGVGGRHGQPGGAGMAPLPPPAPLPQGKFESGPDAGEPEPGAAL